MNPQWSLLFPGLLVATPLALGRVSPPASILPEPPAPTLRQGDEAEFKKAFRAAMKVGAADEMASMVKGNTDHAVKWVIGNCLEISRQSSEVLETETQALGRAWKKAYNTPFVDEMYKYFSLLSGPKKRERLEIVTRYDRVLNAFQAAKESRDSQAFEIVGRDIRSIGEAFEAVGDRYHASQSWSIYGTCMDEPQRGDDADLREACKAYGKVVEHREAIGLKDSIYRSTKPVWEDLERRGFGAAPDADEGTPGRNPGEITADAELAPVLLSDFEFEATEDYLKIPRPNYALDDSYAVWPTLYLRAKGSDGTFSSVQTGPIKKGPRVERVGFSDVQIDSDGDGQVDMPIPLTGNTELIEIELDHNGRKVPWAFLARIGIERDRYQMIDFNLGLTDLGMSIYTLPAGSMSTTLGDTPLRIFDDNMDGVYGSPPLMWNHVGTTEERSQPDVDSVLVGKEKRARPWSELMEVDGQWYRFEQQDSGGIGASPVTLDTGTIKLDAKGQKPAWVIVKGTDKLENVYFDLAAAGKKGIEVPVGRYELFFGLITKGKKMQVMKALMLPGKRSPTYRVERGNEVTVELGAPYGFVAEFDTDSDSVVIDGFSLAISGRGGEVYERCWNCRPRPEISVRAPGEKRGSKPEKMKLVDNQNDIVNHDEGWAVMWFPLDIEIPLRDAEEGAEVQFTEKKNKLFGKITGEWLE